MQGRATSETAGAPGMRDRYKTLPARGTSGIMRDKVRPARGLHRCFRDKVRPAQPLLRCFREKTRPARHKPPILGHFSCAGRTISRSLPPPDQAGRTLYRTRGRCRYKTLPARSLGEPNRYKTLPARPKYPFSTHFAPAGRILYRFHHQYATQGEESHAPTRTSPHQRAPPPISHAIRLHETSTMLRNAAIPTPQIHSLKESWGNCMRNC